MKMKSIVVLVLSGLLAFTITGCSGSNESNPSTQELEKKIAALEKENTELKEKLKVDGETAKEQSEPADKADKAPEAANQTIEVNKAKTIDGFAELTITGAKFANKIVPSKPDSFYTYYEVKDTANTYFDVVIKVKSLLTTGKGSNEFVSVKVVYDDKYEYDPFTTIEKNGGSDFTYTNITEIEPLKTGTLHYIAEVPAGVAKDKKPIKVIISCNGEDYTYTYR
ncbi:hypothetical protein M3661_08075 [Paenibacillus sp. MER 180]|uniref:hypothetical protein n=1 Tax=Paenibacillus sp. MER 180 TaxID=2939570 RepID=UPI0020410FCC|nr:hypothetical protein [Paenibacillus sp. MER 180]MCM3290084.1 hypothetical protein [Paenibacillus sp. MER 180]